MEGKYDKLFDRLSQLLIALFAFTFVCMAIGWPCGPIGESDDYVIATISIQNHGSLNITSEDVESVKNDFPDLYDYVKSNFDNQTGYPIGLDGNQYPFYVGTYSIAAIPIKWFLRIICGEPQRAYMLANVVYYLLALLTVYFGLKSSRKAVFVTLLMLICSASVIYFFWTSAEMFICALMIVSIVFFVNDNHHLSGLFAAIAATLNITICGWGLFIIVDYFIKIYRSEKKEEGKINIPQALYTYYKNIILLVICFLPFIYTPLFNIITFGIFTPQASMSTTEDLFGRFLAYWFDLNLGFMPYYPIALLMFIITLVSGLLKKERKIICLGLGCVATVFLFSFMVHINCGQTLISRYNSWTAPLLVFMLTTQSSKIFTGKFTKYSKYVPVACILSAMVTVASVLVVMQYNMGAYMYFNSISKYVLDNVPALYNPLPSTFASRVLHLDVAYSQAKEKPIIYTDDGGLVRKILVPSGKSEQVAQMIWGNSKAMEYIVGKIAALQSNNTHEYINIPKDVVLFSDLPESLDPLFRNDLARLYDGVSGWEQTVYWLSPDATVALKAEKIEKAGLELDFSSVPFFEPFTDDKAFTVDIAINDNQIRTLSLDCGQSYSIKIPAEDLPPPDGFGLYRLHIVSNGKYNPKEFGHSEDNRDLAIAVSYIGAIRE